MKKLDLRPHRPHTNEEAIVEYYRLGKRGQEFALTSDQERLRLLCEKCLTYMLEEIDRPTMIGMLIKDSQYRISTSYAHTVIKMTSKIFGSTEKVPIEIERQIAINDFKRIQKIAEKDGDYKTSKDCRIQIAKLQNLYEKEDGKVRPLPSIELTTDPEVLKQVYEDVDHEDVTDNPE